MTQNIHEPDVCRNCLESPLLEVFNAGPQPPGNIYLQSRDEDFPVHPLRLGVCPSCGLVQLIDPMPEKMVHCQGPGPKLNEPEKHLDELAMLLLAGVDPSGLSVSGASEIDDSLLKRLEKQGCKISTEEKCDILVARRILEHAFNPREFIANCLERLKPGGLLVLEVPDCERMFHNNWHFFVWEEHIIYFTPATLRGFISQCGLEAVDMINYELPLENSLVILARKNPQSSQPEISAKKDVDKMIAQAKNFGASFAASAANARARLQECKGRGNCFFGAGHLGLKYINFYGLGKLLDVVLDGNPAKQGLFLPDCGLEIKSPAWLASHPHALCLMAINPDSQQKVIGNFSQYQDVIWQSIFMDCGNEE